MSKRFTIGSLLLLTSALYAPAALAQDTGAQPAPAPETPPVADEPVDGEVVPGQEVEVSIPGANLDGGEIVVTGQRGTRNILRAAPQVLNILTEEDIARTGEGDIAGALTRVTGLSVVGNGFVYVRGLGDRYSLSLLNGSPLPSPEPLRRVVPLDIFPTSLVASSLVQKTYGANYPGEFGGGVINLTTRAIPDETFIQISGSVTANTETNFQLGYTYYGSQTDWTGFDNGARDVPTGLRDALTAGNFDALSSTARRDIAASLTNSATSVLQRNDDIPANTSISISGGTSTEIGDGGRLGMIASFGYSNSWRTRASRQQSSGDINLAPGADGLLNSDFDAVVTDNRIIVNGLLGFGLEFGEHRIRWTNLYVRDTLKQGRLASGYANSGIQEPNAPDANIDQDTNWFERQLIDTQLVGEFDFGDVELNTRAAYANTRRNSPYEREFRYRYDTELNTYINALGNSTDYARISFAELNEDIYSGGADLTYRMPNLGVVLTGGYAYTLTQRSSSRYTFQFTPGVNGLPRTVQQLRPDFLLSDYSLYTYGIDFVQNVAVSGAPAYDAELEIHAGYLSADWDIGQGLSANVGVRYEQAEQSVLPIGATAFTPTLLDNGYWLPTATLTWNFQPDMQLRAHASRTIARPQFRELAPQLYQDYESDRELRGNPYLTDSTLTNFEGRYEWYFERGQRLALSGFYKKIDNPIEAVSFLGGGGNPTTGYVNAPEATLWGAEVELQAYVPLADLGGFFSTRRILFVANYTYTQSRVSADGTVIAGPVSFNTPDLRPSNTLLCPTVPASPEATCNAGPMTGQSDHLYNLQISLEDTERLSQVTLLFNYASDRVTSRGPLLGSIGRQPDIVESPGFRMDLVARQAVPMFGGEAEFQAEVRNVFGRGYREFQESATNRISINSYDVGTTFSLGLSVRF